MKLYKIIASFERKEHLYSNLNASALFLILLILSACKKDNLPYGEGKKLVKIIATEDDSVGVSIFKYENDLLVSITQTTNNTSTYHTTLHYNASGKLVQSDEVYGPTNYFRKAFYSYSNDRIIMKIDSDAFGDTIKNIYSYNAQGKLIADTLYQSGYPSYSYTVFKYNTNDNMEEFEYFYNDLGTWQKVGAVQATYNNEINPYKSIGLMYYIIKGYDENKFTLTSKNLVTQLTTGLGPISYNYEYYPNGLPKKVLITSNYANRTKLSTIEFFYE